MKRADRPTFIVHLRPEPHVDDVVRALRGALKVLLRRFGLRALSVRPAPTRRERSGTEVRS